MYQRMHSFYTSAGQNMVTLNKDHKRRTQTVLQYMGGNCTKNCTRQELYLSGGELYQDENGRELSKDENCTKTGTV